jgi:hypothetical protein
MRFSTRLGARERCLGCLSITISYSTILLQDIGKKKARKKLRQHSLALLSLTLGNPKQRSCENEKQITVYCMMICLGAHRWILCSDPLEKKILCARVTNVHYPDLLWTPAVLLPHDHVHTCGVRLVIERYI